MIQKIKRWANARKARALWSEMTSSFHKVTRIPEGATVSCKRLKGYDFEMDVETWKNAPSNQSLARGISCGECGEEVIMSNGTYAKYLSGEFREEQVRCDVCTFALIEKLGIGNVDLGVQAE